METTKMVVSVKGTLSKKEHSFLRKNGITVSNIGLGASGQVESSIVGPVIAVENFLSELRPDESIYVVAYL
jgi:hypothetical protein